MAKEDRSDTSTESSGAPASKDFQRLRETGQAAGISRAIGSAFIAARDSLARILLRCGATPNRLTWAGFLMTIGAGYCLARGASQQLPYFYTGTGPVGWWPLGAAGFLILSAACDMLDGAVARLGNLASKYGAILDSSIDRFSDMAIFIGCGLHFARDGNITYQMLAIVALCNAFLISYIKARAEDIIPDCSVGYWLRGERFAAMLIACLCGHLPAVLWQQALLPLLTVLRRLIYSYQAVTALETGRPAPVRGPRTGWLGRFQLWRHPRGSIPYDSGDGNQHRLHCFRGSNLARIVGHW